MSNIWLTRPQQQADALIAKLTGRGANVLHLPMLKIEPLDWDADIKARILNFDQYDLAIFISTNAAKLGMECVSNYWPQYPAHIKNFALGATTAAVLQSYDLLVSYPDKVMSSEAVLALSALSESEVFERKVLIFRGVGGREVLAEGLRNRGSRVDYVALYQRKLPEYSAQYLQECLQNSPPDAIVISSAEALENFRMLFSKDFWSQVYQVPLYVSSPRIRDLALNFGFEEIIAMSGANDKAIIVSLAKAGLSVE